MKNETEEEAAARRAELKKRKGRVDAAIRRSYANMVRSCAPARTTVRNPWERQRGVKRRQRLMQRRQALIEAAKRNSFGAAP